MLIGDKEFTKRKGCIEVTGDFLLSGACPLMFADLQFTPLAVEASLMSNSIKYGGISPLFYEVKEGEEARYYTPKLDPERDRWVIE